MDRGFQPSSGYNYNCCLASCQEFPLSGLEVLASLRFALYLVKGTYKMPVFAVQV